MSSLKKLFSGSLSADLERITGIAEQGQAACSRADAKWLHAVAAAGTEYLSTDSRIVHSAAVGLVREWSDPTAKARDEAREKARLASQTTAIGTPHERRGLRIVGGAKCREEAKPRPLWNRLADVAATRQDWLWPGRFPRGTVSLIAGQKGDGKSTFLSELIAIVTGGRIWPDGGSRNTPASVIVLQDEESLSSMIRPRVDRFGGDSKRVACLTGVARGASEVELSFSLARDVDALEVLAEEIGDVAMVLIDPIGSYMTGISGYCEGETREAINPLFKFAERYKIAVVAVAHLNKAGDKGIDDRISGTFALPAKARMVWYLSRDPSNRSRRLLTHLKGNLDEGVETGLAFSYPKKERLAWSAKPVRLDARQVDNQLRRVALEERMGMRQVGAERKSRLPAAKAFVVAVLEGGPVDRTELRKKAEACGLKVTTYHKAVTALIEDEKRVVEDGDPPRLRLLPALEPAPEPAPESTPETASETPS